MKILYCIAGLFNSAGMERIITDKANYLAEHGHSVTIVTAEQCNRKPYFSLHPNIRLIDIGICYSETSSFIKKLINYPIKRFKHRIRLKKVLYTIKPDIAITTMGNEFLFLYNIKDGSKKIAEIHFAKGYRLLNSKKLLWCLRDKYRSWQEEIKLKKYDKFIVLTNEDRKNWRGFNNIDVIPNFVEISELIKLPKIYKRLICVGRLSYVKGYDLLIRACSLIKKELQGWSIDIFGNGELYNELISQINIFGLQNIINIHHTTSNISEEYLVSDALILTSRHEGFGMVLIEAMSYGVPVIAFACPCGPLDIIEPGVNGVLVENGNVKALAKNIVDLIQNEDKMNQMGKNARERIKSSFDKEKVMQKWIRMFNDLIEKE